MSSTLKKVKVDLFTGAKIWVLIVLASIPLSLVYVLYLMFTTGLSTINAMAAIGGYLIIVILLSFILLGWASRRVARGKFL